MPAAAAAGARRVLSIAAGVSIATIQAAAGAGVAVVRAMPNTPALVGAGRVGDRRRAAGDRRRPGVGRGVLGAVGTVARVDERHLDAVTALTGSGPAYVFLVAEALIDAGVAAGLARPLAESLTTQLFVGSAALLADRGDPAALREMVTSPGGHHRRRTAACSKRTPCARRSPRPSPRRRAQRRAREALTM